MTDEPPAPLPTSEPAAPPPERARVEPSARRRWDLLPVLYLIGFVVLAGTLFFLYRNPPPSKLAPQEASRVEGLHYQMQALRDQVTELQSRPAPASSPAPDVTRLQDRLTALETRPAPAPDNGLSGRVQQLEARQGPDLAGLTARIEALERRPQPDLGPVMQRIEALEKRPPVDLGPVSSRIDQLAAQARDAAAQADKRLDAIDARIAAVETQAKQTASALDAINQRTQRAVRLQGASAALAAGQKLGEIPGAPPALARFATDAPPTEAGLRLSFEKYAEAAQKASQPAIMDNQDFGTRLWNRAQQVVTVRQGDRVLLGDPLAGVIAHAREALDAGDLQGAVKTLDGLAGPAAAAMKPWTDQARALLEARAAIASMAAS
jgi:hypothetical protein